MLSHPSTNQTANHSEASCIKQNVSARSEEVDELKTIKKRHSYIVIKLIIFSSIANVSSDFSHCYLDEPLISKCEV